MEIIKNNNYNKKMQSLFNIYNAFKYQKEKKEKDNLISIIRGTKSVLTSKFRFKEYIRNYAKATERHVFKTPRSISYPILRKEASFLIPIKISKRKVIEDLKLNNNKKSLDISFKNKTPLLFFSSRINRDSLYRKKLLHNLSALQLSRKILKNKLNYINLVKKKNKKDRYNSLFLDFFHKWNSGQVGVNNNDISCNNISRDFIDCSRKENDKNSIEYIKNDKYSELNYDDHKIFNRDYSNFINERIEFIINNKIENIKNKLESSFDDYNGKEIKLKLESIKINFKLINDKNENNNNLNDKSSSKTNEYEDNTQKEKDIVLYVPLYYAFLFFSDDFRNIRNILVTSIIFRDNFENIIFNDKSISSVLKQINVKNELVKENSFDSKKNANSSKKTLPFKKIISKNFSNFLNPLLAEKFGIINPVNSFNSIKSGIAENMKINKYKKKEVIIHSKHRKINDFFMRTLLLDKSASKDKNEDSKNNSINANDNNNSSNNKNINSYNEYVFLWETNEKSFLVSVKMPMIIFKYKNLKSEVMAYCDRSLFLYLYENNFINWDFYVLNFLFSIKAFRQIILDNYSICKRLIINNINNKRAINLNLRNSKNHSFINKSNDKNQKQPNQRYDNSIYDNSYRDIFNEPIFINNNKNKIYNILNENNESYLFFYTDNSYHNSIINFYSYLINIEYDKLNPKKKWKYYLDFKQMKQLNEITKYESLDTFLPKILKTDFQNGFLSLDFSLFDEFNIEILGYEKKNIVKLTKNKNKNVASSSSVNSLPLTNELCIDINYPYIKVETIIDGHNENNTILFKTKKVDLDINFLQNINNYNIYTWSKFLLLEIFNYKRESIDNVNASPILGDKKLFSKNKVNVNDNSAKNKKRRISLKKIMQSPSKNIAPIFGQFNFK